ncbi:VOC family protein [Janibacter hoylei]|uniref:VOC family protein n=1 Tax=Janibacter hoylei TaxID=364298 RepID=UPI002238EFB5|nr:VOC family protein [Janibacter hoylei]MCW4600934.1 VOC family protein [Janibacter hoylei]
MTAVSWRPSSSAATGWRWRDAQALREWWKGVIGYTDVPGDADMPGHEECMIVDPATGHRVLFIEVPDPTPGKDKMHFALRPTDATPDEEVAQLLTHGASLQADVRGTYGPGTGWVTLSRGSRSATVER